MFSRFLRRGDEARHRRINERGGISKDGPAPSEEPLSAASVLRVFRAMSELDWVRLAAVEEAGSADPDGFKNAERIYRNAYATAGRRGLYDQLGRELLAVRQEAVEVAKAAAGEEALAAHRRFEAVFSGRGGFLVDPADAPAVGRYLGFKDAATNAVSAAALRPYISRRDFAYLWRGYATVLDFTIKAATLAPSTYGSASPTTWTAPERELAAIGYPQVARFVHSLGRLDPTEILALERRLADHTVEAGAEIILDAARGRHGQAGLWQLTIRAVKSEPDVAAATPHLQASAVAAAVALGAKWDIEPALWINAWGPFGETIPYTSVWAVGADEPPEFQSALAVDALARARREFADLLSRMAE